MKIQNDIGNTAAPVSSDSAASKLSRRDRASGVQTDSAQPTADSVSTSEVATRLESDPAHEARLAQLREAVQSSTYSVPASEISARIVDAHLTKRS